MSADNAPEAACVVRLHEVRKFVDDHIVDHEHRRLDEAPIETNIVIHRAGTPPEPVIDDPSCSKLDAKNAGVFLNASENLFFGPGYVPFPQNLTALRLMSRGHQEDLEEFDLTGVRLGYLDAVVSPKIERRLPIHDFLAGRMTAVLIFMRVLKFCQYLLTL
jgi:hypothetical protein